MNALADSPVAQTRSTIAAPNAASASVPADGKLHVFGDSHSVIWGGSLLLKESHASKFPLIEVHHLGPALAFNLLHDDYALGKWGRQILLQLERCTSPTSAIMLSFGEIDIRTQIVKRAHREGLSLEESAHIVADRLVLFAVFLQRMVDVPLFLWSPVATAASANGWNPDQPNVGSELERNLATLAFIDQLRRACRMHRGIHVVSIFERLVTPTLKTRPEFFEDGCHLNLAGLELAIAEFNRVAAAADLSLPDYFDLSGLYRSADGALRDIWGGCKVAASSPLLETPAAFARKATPPWIFHTVETQSPFVLLDVGYGAFVEAIRIFNRFDAHQERARTLTVSAGNDPERLTLVHRQDSVFGLDGMPLSIGLADPAPVRFILLQLTEATSLHLGRIEIFERSLQAF